jgi:hypothetical protein
MPECQAVPTQFGTRCERCGIRWDRDDEAPPCPREVAERAHDEDHDRANRYIQTVRRHCHSVC